VESDPYDGLPVDRLPIDAVDVPTLGRIADHSDRLTDARFGIPNHQQTKIEHSLNGVLGLDVHRTAVAIRAPQMRRGDGSDLVVVPLPEGHPPGGLGMSSRCGWR
jgi:hypothetical protein